MACLFSSWAAVAMLLIMHRFLSSHLWVTDFFNVKPSNKFKHYLLITIIGLYTDTQFYIHTSTWMYHENIKLIHQNPGPWFNTKMTSYQYRKSHCGDKTILRPSYLHNGISYTGKMTNLYWIGAQIVNGKNSPAHIIPESAWIILPCKSCTSLLKAHSSVTAIPSVSPWSLPYIPHQPGITGEKGISFWANYIKWPWLTWIAIDDTHNEANMTWFQLRTRWKIIHWQCNHHRMTWQYS